MDNTDGKRSFGTEEVIIKNKNEYYVNNILYFKIKDFKIDRKHGKISFIKVGVLDDRILRNELKIISGKLFVGTENENTEVNYERIN